jgi:hypothetical protein
MTASKKGISSHQLHRTLGVTYKTAWFMSHRVREAMRSGELAPFGANGGIVEVDETFIGNDRTIKPKHTKKGRGYAHKHKVLALISIWSTISKRWSASRERWPVRRRWDSGGGRAAGRPATTGCGAS